MRHVDLNRLAEFAEGALDGAAQAETASHLRECEYCRTLLAQADDVTGGGRGGAGPALLFPIAVGDRVGRYRVEEWLGAGGMGVVVRAHDPELARDVALKLIDRTRSGDHGRVLSEARLAARISHPNVVAVYDVGAEGGRLFIAAELVRGETLARWLATGRRRVDEIVAAFVAAGHGLAAAHDAGVVHGDFKPSNVLLGDGGRIKVADFGLSRLAEGDGDGNAARTLESAKGPTHTIAGTPRYMAPERWTGQPADRASDQFSFAVALYDALFASHVVLEGPTTRLARIGPVLLKAMSAAPGERFRSIHALLETLKSPPKRRGPRWALATLAVAAVAAAALATLRHTTSGEHAIASASSAGGSSVSIAAAEALREAATAYRDARNDAALRAARRALAGDPELAAAHLLLALYGDVPLEERRRHVEIAITRGEALSRRDRALLGALAFEWQAGDGSYAEYASRLEALATEFVEDAELATLAASTRG
jgi:eukaryotic-like serine/threonine-protein kinase